MRLVVLCIFKKGRPMKHLQCYILSIFPLFVTSGFQFFACPEKVISFTDGNKTTGLHDRMNADERLYRVDSPEGIKILWQKQEKMS